MYSFCPSTTVYRGFPPTSLSESALKDTESSEMLNIVQTSKSIYDHPSSDTSDFMKYLTKRVQIKTGFPVVHQELVNQSQSESSLHTNVSSREIKPVRASKSSYDEPSNLSPAAMRWIATRELLKTGFPETYLVKVKQSRSESSLRRKDSSRLFKTVRASKSIHNVHSIDSQKPIKRLNKRAKTKSGKSERHVEIKESRPLSDLCAIADRKEILRVDLDNTLSEKTKKRERPATPPSDEQLELKRPKLETLSSEELVEQEIPCVPFVNACLKRELVHDKNTHHNLREIEELNAAPSTSRQPLIQPDIITSTRPVWFENQFAEDDEDLDAEVAMIMDKKEPPTVCPDRCMLEFSGLPPLLHERTIEEFQDRPLLCYNDVYYEQCSSPISTSCAPFVNACLKRELAHDKNTHHNLREIEILNAAPSTSRQPLIQPDIITSIRPAWFENQFAEDDEDLDAEVAMIMDKGEPPIVCPDRCMLEFNGLPPLLHERTIEEFQDRPLLCYTDGYYEQCSSPISIRCEPSQDAIKILSKGSTLHENKEFGEPEKKGVVQTENSQTVLKRTSC